MDIENQAKKLMEGKHGAALDALAHSEAGARLIKMFDITAMERAVKTGDSKTLSLIVGDVLKTPEGREFAAKLHNAVKEDGK